MDTLYVVRAQEMDYGDYSCRLISAHKSKEEADRVCDDLIVRLAAVEKARKDAFELFHTRRRENDRSKARKQEPAYLHVSARDLRELARREDLRLVEGDPSVDLNENRVTPEYDVVPVPMGTGSA